MNTATTIQSDINTRAQEALDKQNLGWVNLAVDGRDITLTGSAPNKEAKDAADQAVRINGYNLIENQLTVTNSTATPQDSDQNNSPQVDTKNIEQPKEQTTDSDDNSVEDTQKTKNTPTIEPPVKQNKTQKAEITKEISVKQDESQEKEAAQEAPIKQVKASKDCQKKFNQILKTPIYFNTSSDSVQKNSIRVLNKLALAAKECGSFNLVIHGHSDSTGKASLNKKLSHGRAKAVMKYLIDQRIDSKRLTAQGHGSSEPVASNKTNVGRARNRRIEITIEDKQ